MFIAYIKSFLNPIRYTHKRRKYVENRFSVKNTLKKASDFLNNG